MAGVVQAWGDRSQAGPPPSRDAGETEVQGSGAPRAQDFLWDKGLGGVQSGLLNQAEQATSVSQGSQEMLVGRRVRTLRQWHGLGWA